MEPSHLLTLPFQLEQAVLVCRSQKFCLSAFRRLAQAARVHVLKQLPAKSNVLPILFCPGRKLMVTLLQQGQCQGPAPVSFLLLPCRAENIQNDP